MLQIIQSVKVNHYSLVNELEFRAFLRSAKIAREFSFLPIQKFKSGKKVFLLVQEKSLYFNKLFNRENEKIIGYCIVEDFREMPSEIKDQANIIFKIPCKILNEYPIIISDFVIKKDCRGKGYGRRFAEYIILNIYKGASISLQADEDGLFFWPKMGFKMLQNQQGIMVLNKS